MISIAWPAALCNIKDEKNTSVKIWHFREGARTENPMQTEQADRIIRSLYEGILAPEGWQGVLGQLRELTESEQTLFLVRDKHSNNIAIAEIACLDLPFIEDYERTFSAIDPGTRFVEKTPVGEWYVDERDFGLELMRRHDFYQQFFRDHGMSTYMTTPLFRNARIEAGLSLVKGAGSRYSQPEDAQALAPLMPHLLQACALRWRFKELSHLAQLGQHVLDRMQAPVLVVDAAANVLFTNRAGQQWLGRKQQPFSRQAMGRQSDLGAQLQRLARKICDSKRQTPNAGGLKLESCGGADAPAYLVGLPLRCDHPIAQQWSQPVGLIVVHDLSRQHTLWPCLMRQLFGLTPAELRLLEGLPQHDSLSELAATLGLSLETVRSQLKSVFQKTGVRTQAALARLIVQFSHLQ